MLRWKPSQIACSAIYIAKKVLKRSHAWSEFMCEQTGYDEKAIRECAKELCIILNYARTKPNYQAVYKKFSLVKYMEVAKI